MKNKQMIAVGVSVIVVLILLLSNSTGSLFLSDTNSDLNLVNVNNTNPSEEIDFNKLIIEDTFVGNGRLAERGKIITVHYTGALSDGTVFDSSLNSGVPFSFTLGAGQVILGWEEGFQGMREGGKRKLTIPPEMGYGSNSFGPIPANSTLIFEVELLEVVDIEGAQ